MKVGVIGSTGAIGTAFIKRLLATHADIEIHSFSSKEQRLATDVTHHQIDYNCEESIKAAAQQSYGDRGFDMVLVTTGLLHNGDALQPEKSLRDLSAEKFQTVFQANSILPALVAKHFLPLLRTDKRAVFAALSARVGSISDNRLGGWYAYRASKAALNMILKNAAIEMARRHKKVIILGLHPGTVDSDLSDPFQSNVQEGKLFTPDYAAQKLLHVIKNASPNDSGKCLAWDGQEVEP